LHILKADQYFVSPLLGKTEWLDSDSEYWFNFDDGVLSGITFSELEPPTYFDKIPDDSLTEITAAESEAVRGKLVEFNMHYLVTHLGILPGFEVSLHDDEFIFLDKRRLFTARLLKWFPGVALMIVLAIGQQSFFKMSVYA
jgi:hypothetical protein